MSLLMETKHVQGEAKEMIERCGDIPVYTAEFDVLTKLTGFALTRGALCAMYRPKLQEPEEICAKARRIAVLENVVNPTNVGAIFRSAAALSVCGHILPGIKHIEGMFLSVFIHARAIICNTYIYHFAPISVADPYHRVFLCILYRIIHKIDHNLDNQFSIHIGNNNIFRLNYPDIMSRLISVNML